MRPQCLPWRFRPRLSCSSLPEKTGRLREKERSHLEKQSLNRGDDLKAPSLSHLTCCPENSANNTVSRDLALSGRWGSDVTEWHLSGSWTAWELTQRGQVPKHERMFVPLDRIIWLYLFMWVSLFPTWRLLIPNTVPPWWIIMWSPASSWLPVATVLTLHNRLILISASHSRSKVMTRMYCIVTCPHTLNADIQGTFNCICMYVYVWSILSLQINI